MEELYVNRRTFVKQTATLAALGFVANSPLAALAKKSQSVTITILHTNDWHSRIEAFGKDGGNNAGLGGAATRAALIQKIRDEAEHVLLLDAGDIFQGTPYFNFYNGELEYKLMTKMGYDLATFGNHDFDNGIDGIVSQLPYAGFSFVNCNYDFGKTALANHVKPYQVFHKGGIKIGVLGVGIELSGLVPDNNFKGITYHHPIEHANRIASKLKKEEKCDLVICLSHLGYKYQNDKISDIRLAEKSEYIDLIIGGHTHTFLPKPDSVKNSIGKTVLVNQVGWAGVQLGRIDYTFEPLLNKALTASCMVLDIA